MSLALDGVETTMTPKRLIKPKLPGFSGNAAGESARGGLQCWAVVAGRREPK